MSVIQNLGLIVGVLFGLLALCALGFTVLSVFAAGMATNSQSPEGAGCALAAAALFGIIAAGGFVIAFLG